MTAEHLEGRLDGAGGVELYWQAWLPESEVSALVVIAHGVSEHSARYGHVGERLAGAGYAAYALDHRGHGRSQGKRAMLESVDDVVADLHSFIDLAAARHPGAPVYLLGHSMGGASRSRAPCVIRTPLRGCCCPGRWPTPAPPRRSHARSAGCSPRSPPGSGCTPWTTLRSSRDPEVVRAYDQDPLVYHGKLPARTVAELTGAVARFPEDVPALRLPLLVMHGGADSLTTLAGSRMVHERASSSDKTLEIYDGLRHEIFNEPEKERVLSDVIDWLDARLSPPTPSLS